MKKCAKCGQVKLIVNFWKHKYAKDGRSSYCKNCHDEYRKATLTKRNEYSRIRRTRNRQRIINHYGATCVCCGEREYKFLSFDHIQGGGNQHKKIVGRSDKFLSWIIKNNYPNIIQILCHNCNQAKGAWGICPHQEKYGKMENQGI